MWKNLIMNGVHGEAYQVPKRRIVAQRSDMEDLDLSLLVLHAVDYDIRQVSLPI